MKIKSDNRVHCLCVGWMCLLIFTGCASEPSRSVCFRVPEGYTGWICVVLDRDFPKPTVSGETVFYEFMDGPVSRSADVGVLRNFASIRAEYPSGVVIDSIPNADGGGLIVRGLFATSESRFYYFLGRREALVEAMENAQKDVATAAMEN